METDEDVFVVIVGNASEAKTGKTKVPLDIQIKEEIVNDDIEIEENLNYILNVATTYGEVEYITPDSSQINKTVTPIKIEQIDIKLEHESDDYQEREDNGDESFNTGDENDTISDRGDNNTSDDDYIPGIEFVESDDDFIPEEDEDDVKNKDNVKILKKKWKSFVKELKRQDPKLKKSSTMLINTLVQIMKDVKRPPPPPNYYVINDDKFKCVKCGALTDTEPAAWRHHQEKHGERYLVCFACGCRFRSTTNLYKHEKRCPAPDAKVVLKARAMFLGRKGRSRPFLPDFSNVKSKRGAYNNTRRFPCEMCSAVFHSKSNLSSHESLHRGERPYRCHICPAAYTGRSALRRHLEKHSNEKFICDHCNKEFISKMTIATHMDTHLPQKRFGCEECGRRYATKAALKQHEHRVHLGLPPPAACLVCTKRYPRMSILKNHMKTAHGMALMTRRMFFKMLPTLSDAQLKQAKLVLKTIMNKDGDSEDQSIKVQPEIFEEVLNDETGLIERHKVEVQLYNGLKDMMAQPVSYVLTEMGEEEINTMNKNNTVYNSKKVIKKDTKRKRK